MDVVVVGVDGSGNAREALRVAIAEAAWRNAEVIAVNVVHYPVGIGYADGFTIDPSLLFDAGRAALETEVDAVLAEMPDGSPVNVDKQVLLGHTGSQLLGIGDEDDKNVVLTVVGTRGMGGFRGLLVGSVTTYLVHHLTSPILVVPIHEETSG